MLRATLAPPLAGAQWSGIATRLGERLLETGTVDAILTVAPDAADRWKPVPVLVTQAADMAQVRGMRMGYAPLLALLEPARERGYRRIGVIGIPCQVYALRALEAELGFERIYVIGTPCSDNTTTARFHEFLALLTPEPDTVTYLEFRADFMVELRFADGRKARDPVPAIAHLAVALRFFSADVPHMRRLHQRTRRHHRRLHGWHRRTMAAGAQRTRRGAARVCSGMNCACRPSQAVAIAGVTCRASSPTPERAAGGLPLRRMPAFLRPLVSWLMPRIGPKGLEFARARVEMKAVETVLHLRRQAPRRLKSMVPAHVWDLVRPYGLHPQPDERAARPPDGE